MASIIWFQVRTSTTRTSDFTHSKISSTSTASVVFVMWQCREIVSLVWTEAGPEYSPLRWSYFVVQGDCKSQNVFLSIAVKFIVRSCFFYEYKNWHEKHVSSVWSPMLKTRVLRKVSCLHAFLLILCPNSKGLENTEILRLSDTEKDNKSHKICGGRVLLSLIIYQGLRVRRLD